MKKILALMLLMFAISTLGCSKKEIPGAITITDDTGADADQGKEPAIPQEQVQADDTIEQDLSVVDKLDNDLGIDNSSEPDIDLDSFNDW